MRNSRTTASLIVLAVLASICPAFRNPRLLPTHHLLRNIAFRNHWPCFRNQSRLQKSLGPFQKSLAPFQKWARAVSACIVDGRRRRRQKQARRQSSRTGRRSGRRRTSRCDRELISCSSRVRCRHCFMLDGPRKQPQLQSGPAPGRYLRRGPRRARTCDRDRSPPKGNTYLTNRGRASAQCCTTREPPAEIRTNRPIPLTAGTT